MPVGSTKSCPDCGKAKNRLLGFAPRWGHCPDHKPFDPACSACKTLREDPTRQPRCYECDATRDKRPKGSGKKKANKPTHDKADKAATPSEESAGSEEAKPKAKKAKSKPKSTEDTKAALVAAPETNDAAATTSLVVGAPRDSHGSLLRAPAVPKHGGIAVMLRRSLRTFKRRAILVAALERKVADGKSAATVVEDQESTAAVEGREQLARMRERLQSARVAKAFTERRVRLLAGELQRRTLVHKGVAAVYGVAKFERLAAIVDDALDTACLQAGGSDANDAFARIVARIAPHMGKLVYQRVKFELMRYRNRQLAEDEAHSRCHEGIFKGSLDWDHEHESGASLATRCYKPVMRALQIRTRADRAIGVTRNAEGQWGTAATSLDAIGAGSNGDDGFEPHTTSYAFRGANQHGGAASQEQDRRSAIKHDVTNALESLSSDADREIAQAILVADESRKAVAGRMGLTMTALNARLQSILDVLRPKLAPYQAVEEGSDDL